MCIIVEWTLLEVTCPVFQFCITGEGKDLCLICCPILGAENSTCT